MLPLWARVAVGYLSSPDVSSEVIVPKVNPVMLFCGSRAIVTWMSVITPGAEPPAARIRSDVSDNRTAAGH